MSKPLGRLDKVIFAVNTVTAALLLVSYITPYIPPVKLAWLSVLSLTVSPLILINTLFALYWLVKLNRRIWLPVVILVIGYFHFDAFIKWSSQDQDQAANTLRVMSFNVQLFEAYKDNSDGQAVAKFKKLLAAEQPDVICIQEYYKVDSLNFKGYPYRFVHFKTGYRMGHAIYSKFPLLNKGAFDFKETSNNVLYTDVALPNDTIRLYNAHLQSFKIIPSMSTLQTRTTDQLTKRLKVAFRMQQQQMETILKDKEQTSLPVVIAGDLNNTAFSYVYRQLSKEYNDAYVQKGTGLGTTFTVDFYPVRIDYIFADPSLKALDYKTLDAEFSYHRPIISTLGWE